MNIPKDLRYTKEHEWVKTEGDLATVGITDYAQGELGDIVFVELPEAGASTTQSKPFGTVEAVKAVSDLYAPLSGTVEEINGDLDQEPELINQDCYGKGWMIKIKLSDKSEIDNLLSADDYEKEVESNK